MTSLYTHVGIYCGGVSILLLSLLLYNPRLMLKDYPPAIQALVPPRTDREKRQALLIGIPFSLVWGLISAVLALLIR